MSSDTILVAEEGQRHSGTGQRWSMDNLCSQKWLDGHVSGAKQVAHWLVHERATQLFRDGKDDEARIVRDLAKLVLANIVPELERAAQQHKLDHPSELPPEKRRAKGVTKPGEP
jgi:hypothetical protein